MRVGRGHVEVHVEEVTGFELAIELATGVGRERFDAVIGIEERVDELVDLTANQIEDHVSRTVAVEQILAIAINAFSLLVHHFVVIEQALADFVVAFFDLLLGGGDSPCDQRSIRSLRPPSCPAVPSCS